MLQVTIMILGGAVIFGASAVWGLVWAIRHGQLSNFQAGARSIFDDDEPIGEVTDVFPGEPRPATPPRRTRSGRQRPL